MVVQNGDLRRNESALEELFAHIESRESLHLYFYCDTNQLVTIGYGHLVDATDALKTGAWKVMVKRLYARSDVQFLDRLGKPASLKLVLDDWQKVKGARRPNMKARYYSRFARTRILESSAKSLRTEKVNGFIKEIYDKRPFAKGLEPRIQMALVDARYNPSKVALYGKNTTRLWKALDPRSRDLKLALREFVRIWRGKGGKDRERYAKRHRKRVEWFKQGVKHTLWMEKREPLPPWRRGGHRPHPRPM